MAYDPEARRQSNSALTIAIVSALLLGGGLLAYLATRRDPEPGPTTVITQPRRETVIVTNTPAVPAIIVAPTSAPNVIVREVPQTVVVRPAPATNTVTRIERNSTTVRDRVVAPRPAQGSSSTTSPAPPNNTNVTINNAPPAGSSVTNGANNTNNPATSVGNSAPAPDAPPAAATNSATGY